VNAVNKTYKVTVAGRVDPELAQAVRRLADLGNRSVSREVDAALRRHVMLEQFSSQPVTAGGGSRSHQAAPTGGAGERSP
jgi:predicted transcriptional regulator